MKFFAQWTSYRRDVIPREAPIVQLEECRRAFYAGAVAIMALLEQSPDNDTELETYLEDLKGEVMGITKDLRE